MKIKNILLVLTVTTTLGATACSPMVRTHGNMLHEAAISEIQPMVSSRIDVQNQWGPPTTVSSFDPNVWYYIGQTSERVGVFKAEITKRQIVKVTFDTQDTVADLQILNGDEALAFDPEKSETPTAGREFTAFQQFVSNIGRFNQPVPEMR